MSLFAATVVYRDTWERLLNGSHCMPTSYGTARLAIENSGGENMERRVYILGVAFKMSGRL